VADFKAKGKTFAERLEAFTKDAKSTHKVTMRKDEGRTAEWQQKHHVAHMFLYNAYQTKKPANVDKGGKTIAWSHFSDAGVKWHSTVKWKDFLRTKKAGVPQKDGKKWKAGQEPDQEATKKNVKSIQTKGGIGDSGKAMVSSGIAPNCTGEPCKCKAGRSKHLSNLAADLNTQDLKSLSAKLKAAKAGSIDDYLKKFGLWRNLKDHPKSPEEWHVEALPDAKL